MKIETHTPRLRQIRKVAVELLLASHKVECPTCDQAGHCKLEAIAHKLGVDKVRFKKLSEPHPIDNSSYAIVRDPEKCILCGQCVRYCKEIHGVVAIDLAGRGKNRVVTPAFFKPIAETECINCGQCAAVCPVSALTVKKNICEVQKNLDDPTKTCVVHMAPAVRVGIGEEFGLPSNDETAGKSKYHFIEVMTCPGGCVNGGGQPIDFDAYGKIARRTDGLYRADKDLPRRKSQDNPSIIETYKKVLPEGSCGEKLG